MVGTDFTFQAASGSLGSSHVRGLGVDNPQKRKKKPLFQTGRIGTANPQVLPKSTTWLLGEVLVPQVGRNPSGSFRVGESRAPLVPGEAPWDAGSENAPLCHQGDLTARHGSPGAIPLSLGALALPFTQPAHVLQYSNAKSIPVREWMLC